MTDTPEAAQDTGSFGRDLALYTAARVGLLAVITAVLALAHVPLLIALAVGLVLAMPLAMVLFRGLSARLSAGLRVRREQRLRMRAELRGEGGQHPA
ncbi:DUF4229 domain-containing protein [Kutzneria viridogrisea]|uniref:Uncharacterized protein n=2 Tax=Kutzneria TaxID=43356 RepID=W5WU65_9PSEU|nr:DUF4229 domain-containing protein [Kutzneria albida]AHI01675.1 hypothetical protein KALB_8318 [Kutzneria albida DSM 43870]MBA8931638.1 hypothetical protein [Kutzneria viridogrisea]